MQLFLVICHTVAHVCVINPAVVRSSFPLCCGKSYSIHHCASDCPLMHFHFPFSHMMRLSMSCETNKEESHQLWVRGVLDATGSFPEVSLAWQAGVVCQLHRKPGIWIKETQILLLPLLLSEMSMEWVSDELLPLRHHCNHWGKARVTGRSLSHWVAPHHSAEAGRGGWHPAVSSEAIP